MTNRNTERFAIIFDLDGTLVDAFQDITDAVNAPLRRRGHALHSMATIKSMVGDGAGKLLDRAAPDIPEEDQAAFRSEMLEYYREHPADHAYVYEGVFPMLDELRTTGVRLGILSNKPQAMCESTCEKMGLLPYFEDICGANVESGYRKPDPKVLLDQMARMGVDDVIMVGDGIPDGQVAASTGNRFVAVTWGTRSGPELAELNPVGIADDVPRLAEILSGLIKSD